MQIQLTVFSQTFRKNNSDQKGGRGGESQTVFVKGFDRSLDEDQVIIPSCGKIKSIKDRRPRTLVLKLSSSLQIRSSLEEHFGSCGEITRISVPKEYETGAPRGWVIASS